MRPRPRCGTPARRATATSTPRRCTATSRVSARASGSRAWTAPRCSSPASSTTDSTGPTTPAAPSTRRWPNWDPTTSTCSSSTGRCPPCTTATSSRPGRPSGVQGRRPGPQHRGVQLPDPPPAGTGPRDRDHPGGQPDRGAPPLRQRCGAPHGVEHDIATEAWSPIAQGKVLQGTRWWPASPGRPARTRPRWCCAGTSNAATSSSRNRSAATHAGELRDLRL